MRLFVLAVLVGVYAFSPARAETITLAADVWCPYNCAPDAEAPGFALEIAKAVFEKSGDKIEYKVMPWARAIEEGRAGHVTGIIGAFKEDAPDYVFPTEELTLSGNEFWVKKGNPWRYNGMASLEQIGLGVIKDYSYDEAFDKYVQAHKKDPKRVQIVSGDDALEKNIKKLIGERFDATIEDRNVMAYALKSMGKEELVVSAGSLGSDKAYIAFSPKNPKSAEYAARLSEGMAEMRSTGQLKEIMAKYGM